MEVTTAAQIAPATAAPVPAAAQAQSSTEKSPSSEKSQSSEKSNATAVDAAKSEPSNKSSKKRFSFAPLKKVGTIRLVNGFRSSKLRPKIALDTQKDVADNVREWLYERRNKYEKFVDNVLGKANPLGAKQPAPGAPQSDDAAALAAVAPTPAPSVVPGSLPNAPTVPSVAVPPVTQRDGKSHSILHSFNNTLSSVTGSL